MNEKINFTGGEPTINFNDLSRNNIANRAALFAVMAAYNIGTNENFIISGCVATVDPGVDVDVTAGYIFLNGEIIQVEAQTVLDSGTTDLYKYVKTTTYDPNGDKTFNNSVARQTWAKNRGIVTAATAPILTTELDVVNGDRLESKIIALLRALTAASATDALEGIIRKSTVAETQAGTSDTGAVTPLKLRTHTTWTAPSLATGYTGTVEYMRDNLGFIHFKGTIIKSGSPSSKTVFTLPVGFRPLVLSGYALPMKNAALTYQTTYGPLVVNTGGTVNWENYASFAANDSLDTDTVKFIEA
jgi:hypothetical protein